MHTITAEKVSAKQKAQTKTSIQAEAGFIPAFVLGLFSIIPPLHRVFYAVSLDRQVLNQYNPFVKFSAVTK